MGRHDSAYPTWPESTLVKVTATVVGGKEENFMVRDPFRTLKVALRQRDGRRGRGEVVSSTFVWVQRRILPRDPQ